MKNATSLLLLRRVVLERLPLILTDDCDLEAVSVLVQAGLLEATMQVVLDPRGGGPLPGVVIRGITRLGWMALQGTRLGTILDLS